MWRLGRGCRSLGEVGGSLWFQVLTVTGIHAWDLAGVGAGGETGPGEEDWPSWRPVKCLWSVRLQVPRVWLERSKAGAGGVSPGDVDMETSGGCTIILVKGTAAEKGMRPKP